MEGEPCVLVVEDDAALRLMYRLTLEPAGWRVVEAGTLAEARAALPSVDVVLLDLHVGHEDGRELLAEAKRDRPGLGVVLLTGSGDLDGETREAADGILGKPFEEHELLEALAGATRRVNEAR